MKTKTREHISRSIKKNDKINNHQKTTDQSDLDAEISRFAEKVESSINMDYILKKIIR